MTKIVQAHPPSRSSATASGSASSAAQPTPSANRSISILAPTPSSASCPPDSNCSSLPKFFSRSRRGPPLFPTIAIGIPASSSSAASSRASRAKKRAPKCSASPSASSRNIPSTTPAPAPTWSRCNRKWCRTSARRCSFCSAPSLSFSSSLARTSQIFSWPAPQLADAKSPFEHRWAPAAPASSANSSPRASCSR